MSTAILMPAFNEATALLRTLRALGDRGASLNGVTVFLVDDGSDPPIELEALPARTSPSSSRATRSTLARGPRAPETARQLALGTGPFDAYITMDADGQHRVEDVVVLAGAIAEGADVAFGNRFLGDSNVPRARRWVLRAARVFEQAVTGLRLADAHNGLRAFSRRALEQVTIRQNRMAHATEIKQRVSRAGELVIVEVPVSLRYTRESLAKGQTSLGAVVIVRDLLLQYLFGEP